MSENSYEQKIKEEDEKRARLLAEGKARYRNSLLVGLVVAIPTIGGMGLLITKNFQVEKELKEKRAQEFKTTNTAKKQIERLYF